MTPPNPAHTPIKNVRIPPSEWQAAVATVREQGDESVSGVLRRLLAAYVAAHVTGDRAGSVDGIDLVFDRASVVRTATGWTAIGYERDGRCRHGHKSKPHLVPLTAQRARELKSSPAMGRGKRKKNRPAI